MTAASLVAEAVAILRDVADAATDPAAARELAGEIEAAFRSVPWRVGIGGDDLADRTATFDFLAGGGVLAARPLGCAPIRVRRADLDRFVARHEHGPSEERRAPPPPRAARNRALAWLRGLVARLFRRPQLPAAPDGFVARLRELASGSIAGITELVLDVARGPLARDVEAIELADPVEMDGLDAVLIVVGTRLCTADSERRSLGELPRATAALPRWLEQARAQRLADRALDATARIVAAVDAEDRAAAADFAGRVEDLEDLRVEDPARFTREQLERIGPQILPSVATVMEHAAAHLGADVAAAGREWLAAIEGASSNSELGDAVKKINDTSAASVRQIAEDARLLVMGGIGGCVRDLAPQIAQPLRKHGLPEALLRSPSPPLPAVDVLRSLAASNGVTVGHTGWFGALFRSLDARRSDTRNTVEGHVGRLEQLAVAEMRDAEPKLRAALEAALAGELAAALERQRAWLDSAIAAEHAEFALRGERLAGRTARVDAARRAARELRERVGELRLTSR